MEVFGYELLFWDGNINSADIADGTKATSQLIANVFLEIGIENIVNNKYAFINLTRDYIVGDVTIPISNEKIVLEVLEDIHADEDCVAGLSKLKKQGFTIALDDFILEETNSAFVPLADIIKIDILAMTTDELRVLAGKLKHGKSKLLAEKVETEEEYQLCKELGFDYFQGCFFSKPKIISYNVGISYKLLKILNSPFYATQRLGQELDVYPGHHSNPYF
ncbi:MAG: EAL domain-containing protein [Pseudomonadales bacterium]|jgi:EAL and modified HD-GYP domain-containing signal transduction protein